MNALAEELRRLALLFPRGLETQEASHPEVWSQIVLAEQRVDHVALEYIAGRSSKDTFERTLRAHEAAWRRGAEALAGHRPGGRP